MLQREVFSTAKFRQRLGRVRLTSVFQLFEGFFARLFTGFILHLGTLAAGDVLFKIGFADTQGGVQIAVSAFVHHDVWDDALGLDGATTWGVVPRGGDLQTGVSRQLANGLHRALAEGLAAHDGGLAKHPRRFHWPRQSLR